ncbi:MAG: hypothetical protein Q9203_007651 [Teloschistes exilis]
MDFEEDNEGTQTIVRLAQFSVKEYLVSERILKGDARRYNIQEINANISIYNDCLAYLLEFKEFNCSSFGSPVEIPLAEYAAEYWTKHAQIAERYTGFNPNLTRELLTKKDGLLNWIRLYDPDKPWKGANPKMLLDKGADVNVPGGPYSNALQAASFRGHDQVVQMLLDKGADVNAPGGYYGNALQAASLQGHDQVVQMLLDKGADVNAQGEEYGNALQAASFRGHDQVVQMLLDKGAM